ncbi:hypothetical protein GH714_006465 [Hevea brasiliensis]|uniref:Uncharacterized protein n=1 Tax=Hevea brasiliensis TaxID=3981 RepID=A0A6A6MY40_HEVBR|nr:hypothetical protein GH714_006465 [Hevea brasiliensis]
MPKTPYELMFGKKPSLKHFHVWVVRQRGSRFYCPTHSTRVIESDCAVYFEDEMDSGSQIPCVVDLRDETVVFTRVVDLRYGTVVFPVPLLLCSIDFNPPEGNDEA